MEVRTKVVRCGNGLAVRIPAALVQALDLKEGDEIEIAVLGRRAFDIGRDRDEANRR